MAPKEPLNIPTLPFENLLLPDSIQKLDDLAFNLLWTWTAETRALFRRIEWRNSKTKHKNPVEQILGRARHDWKPLVEDLDFQDQYRNLVARLNDYISQTEPSWFRRNFPDWETGPVAYFSMEYGLHDCLQLYSGGLGVLSGDHLKAASDLGIPLVAVGLLYAHGYFYQEIGLEGRQQHIYPNYDFSRLPIRTVKAPQGGPLLVPIEFPGRTVFARVWKVQVGRVPLLLLDTDIRENDPADRPITGQLYVAGREMRLCQEIVLGIGGVRTLRVLGVKPSAWHLNEGHSALLCLERIREFVDEGRSREEAVEEVRAATAFTTHTPVPAGQEQFDRDLMERHLAPFTAGTELDSAELLALGSPVPEQRDSSSFSLTALALRLSAYANGVSALHGEVSRSMFGSIRDETPEATPPIVHITNGIHAPTWIGRDIRRLLDSPGEDDWTELFHNGDPGWDRTVEQIPDADLWTAHQSQKNRLFRVVRQQVSEQMARHGAGPDELRAALQMFSPEIFTIGFARRFATYKRAGLLFSDPDRLHTLVNDEDRPVQILYAGKSHPADEPGQETLRSVYQFSKDPSFSGRIVVLENYTMRLGRFLVGGVDLWLNTPRRPHEASGTSGMKAALNGVIHCSILDGWWDEEYDGKTGWAIGNREPPGPKEEQDRRDAVSLYELLETEIVPLYYDRGPDGLPHEWIARMKASMATLAVRFSADRMVREYTEQAYAPLAGVPPRKRETKRLA